MQKATVASRSLRLVESRRGPNSRMSRTAKYAQPRLTVGDKSCVRLNTEHASERAKNAIAEPISAIRPTFKTLERPGGEFRCFSCVNGTSWREHITYNQVSY